MSVLEICPRFAVKKSADGIATFFKTLIDAGMGKDQAHALTMIHVTDLQKQFKPPRHAIRIPHIADLPEVPEVPEIPDLKKAFDAAGFHFHAGRSDESGPRHDEED